MTVAEFENLVAIGFGVRLTKAQAASLVADIRSGEVAAYDRAKKAALDHTHCARPHVCLSCVTARAIAEDIAALAEEVANGRDV